MPRLELEDLLKPGYPLKQLLLITDFYNQFDNRSGANKYISNVEILCYQGATAATEFLVYSASKLYLAAEMSFTAGLVTGSRAVVYFRSETDGAKQSYQNECAYFDGAVVNLCANVITVNNVWFSRFTINNIDYMTFTGYRITLT